MRKIEDNMILMQFHSKNGRAKLINDSAVGSPLICVYGSFVSSKDNKNIKENNLNIIITSSFDIEVTDMDTSEKILCIASDEIFDYNPLLIYGLTKRFGFLIFRSLDIQREFCIKYGLKREGIKDVIALEYGKAYREFRRMMERAIHSDNDIYTFYYEKDV